MAKQKILIEIFAYPGCWVVVKDIVARSNVGGARGFEIRTGLYIITTVDIAMYAQYD